MNADEDFENIVREKLESYGEPIRPSDLRTFRKQYGLALGNPWIARVIFLGLGLAIGVLAATSLKSKAEDSSERNETEHNSIPQVIADTILHIDTVVIYDSVLLEVTQSPPETVHALNLPILLRSKKYRHDTHSTLANPSLPTPQIKNGLPRQHKNSGFSWSLGVYGRSGTGYSEHSSVLQFGQHLYLGYQYRDWNFSAGIGSHFTQMKYEDIEDLTNLNFNSLNGWDQLNEEPENISYSQWEQSIPLRIQYSFMNKKITYASGVGVTMSRGIYEGVVYDFEDVAARSFATPSSELKGWHISSVGWINSLSVDFRNSMFVTISPELWYCVPSIADFQDQNWRIGTLITLGRRF